MDLGIKGRKALVTGAVGGIAAASVKLLAEAGVDLVLTDVKKSAKDLGNLAKKYDADAITADLSCVSGIKTFIDNVGTDFDILLHTAGITGAKGDPLTMAEDDWMEAYNLDFMSAVRLGRHLGPAMVKRGWGRFVFITSENVAQPYPEETVYNASKSALLSWSKSVAMKHSGSGLMSNCVAPAFIETDMTDGMMNKRADELGCTVEEAVESFLKEERPYLIVGRRGKPAEVAPVIALLCSEHASFITGSNYRVDGGAVGSINI